MMVESTADCARCHNRPKEKGLRFCFQCASIISKEMKESGYLQHLPVEKKRAPGSQEFVAETKHGIDI